jgi:hypothetical protein
MYLTCTVELRFRSKNDITRYWPLQHSETGWRFSWETEKALSRRRLLDLVSAHGWLVLDNAGQLLIP